MMKILDKKNKTVSVIDNYLVLSLTYLDDPVIWRMSLDEVGTAVFAIKKSKDKSNLILKKSDKTSETIASFDNKEEASEILKTISEALLSKGETHTSASTAIKLDKKETSKWGFALLLVLIIIGLYAYLMTLMPERVSSSSQNAPANTTSDSTTGQAIDADEFLRGLQ